MIIVLSQKERLQMTASNPMTKQEALRKAAFSHRQYAARLAREGSRARDPRQRKIFFHNEAHRALCDAKDRERESA